VAFQCRRVGAADVAVESTEETRTDHVGNTSRFFEFEVLYGDDAQAKWDAAAATANIRAGVKTDSDGWWPLSATFNQSSRCWRSGSLMKPLSGNCDVRVVVDGCTTYTWAAFSDLDLSQRSVELKDECTLAECNIEHMSTIILENAFVDAELAQTVIRKNPKLAANATRLRIICLTDGRDQGSGSSPHTVAAALQRDGIVLDSVLVAPFEDHTLRGISAATRGYCFRPPTVPSALKLFELETMLSMADRVDLPKVPVSNTTLFKEIYFSCLLCQTHSL
jgi:hypothetical protein